MLRTARGRSGSRAYRVFLDKRCYHYSMWPQKIGPIPGGCPGAERLEDLLKCDNFACAAIAAKVAFCHFGIHNIIVIH
jgi:hypothetical protein